MTYKISVVQSDSNKNVYVFEKPGKKTPLNSLYSPEKEAHRFLRKLSDLRNSFVVFIGYGNGELLGQLIESELFRRNFQFLFIEPFHEITRSEKDIKIFNEYKEKLSFLYYKELNSMVFTTFLAKHAGIPISIQIHPNYLKTDDSVIKKCLQVIDEGTKMQNILNNTELKYAVDWIVEPLLNIENTSRAIKIQTLKDQFKGEKAILIAAGPSLKDHISFLQENMDNFHLFSVGSALRPLLENDIQPDYVLSIDTSAVNYETHFKGLEYVGTLIFETISNSMIQNSHRGPLIVSKTKSDHVSTQYVENLYGFTQASPSVAIFTLQVIAYLGFSEVYLIGQDLALVNGEYYAKGVKHHEAVKDIVEELTVENNQGDLIGTTKSLKIFLDTFELMIRHLPQDIKIYNLSKNGAKIEGATFVNEIQIDKKIKRSVCVEEASQQKNIELPKVIQSFIRDVKMLQKQISNASANLNRLIKMGIVSENDMPKVVKDFREISGNVVLEKILLSNLTFMFKAIINKFKMFDLKKKYMSQDYIDLIVELEKFYTLTDKFCADIIADERLKDYIKSHGR